MLIHYIDTNIYTSARLHRNPYTDYIEGEVVDIDPSTNEVTVTSSLKKGDGISSIGSVPNNNMHTSSPVPDTFTLKYDKLVYAAGNL